MMISRENVVLLRSQGVGKLLLGFPELLVPLQLVAFGGVAIGSIYIFSVCVLVNFFLLKHCEGGPHSEIYLNKRVQGRNTYRGGKQDLREYTTLP